MSYEGVPGLVETNEAFGASLFALASTIRRVHAQF